MAIGGGLPLLDLAPYEELTKLRPGTRGTHAGAAAGLNIEGAVPGFHYSWIRHPKYDRGIGQLQRFMNMGYQVCGPDSPELRARAGSLNFAQFGLDNYQVHGDVILVRIPEELLRKREDDKRAEAQAALDGPTEDYLQRGRDITSRYGYGNRADGPIYYKSSGHGNIVE